MYQTSGKEYGWTATKKTRLLVTNLFLWMGTEKTASRSMIILQGNNTAHANYNNELVVRWQTHKTALQRTAN
jgi:hypothetical protein